MAVCFCLVNYKWGITFTEGTKVEFREKEGIYMVFPSLAKYKKLRYWVCLISKILTGQYIKGFPTLSVLTASPPILSFM